MVKFLGFDESQFWNTWENWHSLNEKNDNMGHPTQTKKNGFSSNLVLPK